MEKNVAEKDQNIKLFLIKTIKTILSNQYIKVKSSPPENELEQVCNIFINLLQSDSNAYGIYADTNICEESCDNCIKKYDKKTQCININNYYDSLLGKNINKANFILYKNCSISDFKNNIIKPIIKYSNQIKIYDRQISSINNNGNDIKENFKQNIKYWTTYFYDINNNIQIQIYTSCKDIYNKKLVNTRLKDLENDIKSSCKNINLEFLIIDDNIHERYFYTNLIMFSCDRGIDLIYSRGNLYNDIHISIIKPEEGTNISSILI